MGKLPKTIHEEGLALYEKQDYSNAASRFRQAAEQGYAPAQFQLAVCYEKGTGTQKNLYLSLEYYKKAMNQKDRKAKKAYEKLLKQVQQNDQDAGKFPEGKPEYKGPSF